MKATTESLFEAYHSAVNAVGAAAVPLCKQAIQDCEDSIVEVLESWDIGLLRQAASGMRDWHLQELLEEVVGNSRWSFTPYQAQAVCDGADRLGIGAELLDGDEDGPCQQARQILTGALAPQLADIAESILQARVRWAMENR